MYQVPKFVSRYAFARKIDDESFYTMMVVVCFVVLSFAFDVVV